MPGLRQGFGSQPLDACLRLGRQPFKHSANGGRLLLVRVCRRAKAGHFSAEQCRLCRFFTQCRHIPVPLLDLFGVDLDQLEYLLPLFAELPVQFLEFIFVERDLMPASFERRWAAEPVVGFFYIEGIQGSVVLCTVWIYSNRGAYGR